MTKNYYETLFIFILKYFYQDNLITFKIIVIFIIISIITCFNFVVLNIFLSKEIVTLHKNLLKFFIIKVMKSIYYAYLFCHEVLLSRIICHTLNYFLYHIIFDKSYRHVNKYMKNKI